MASNANNDDDTYVLDPFDDGSSKLVGKQLYDKLQSFVSDYWKQLRTIEELLGESLSEVWEPAIDPIGLYLQSYEQTSLIELVRTDNKLFNKIIMVFASLCLEIDQLKTQAKTKIIPVFLAFGCNGKPEEGEAQVQIGKMLPFFLDLTKFLKRVNSVVKNMVHQLSSLYHQRSRIYTQSFHSIHLTTLFESLGDMLATLIHLDEVIKQNKVFLESWANYKRMTRAIRDDPLSYGTDEERLLQFEKLLLSLEGQLFSGQIYSNCIEQEYDFPGVLEVEKNKVFREEFFFTIKGMLDTSLYKLPEEMYDARQGEQFITICALFAAFEMIFKQHDQKKIFKTLWEITRKIPMVHLSGNVSWCSAEFLIEKFPAYARSLSSDWKKIYQEYLKNLDKNIAETIQNYYLQVCVWMVRIESSLQNIKLDTRDILNARINLLLRGVQLANGIGTLCKVSLHLHVKLGVPLKQSDARALCQSIELLKAIQGTFHRRAATIGETLSYMIQHISYSLQRCFLQIKVRLQGNQKFTEAKLDVLASVILAMQMLNSTATKERRLLLRLAMHIAFQMDYIKDSEVGEIASAILKLDIISDIQKRLNESCDCSFLFWSKEILSIYFSTVYKHPEQAHKLQYMLSGLQDVGKILFRAISEEPAQLISKFEDWIFSVLEETILKKLCLDIETDLRLHIHSHLKVSDRNPNKDGQRDLTHFVKVRPLRFFHKDLNMKTHIEHYLDTIFYNLTTVAMHDWKTYAEMRNLAQEKYGLTLTEVHLPSATLEQGLDVLEIMRNIHVFVARYNYNLNNQIFVERTSDSKYLNSINITHIANSIRTHGTGIMNTTVNYTYQFLRQKFLIFSQFLFDDHIKSRLFKDILYFKENKEKLLNRYPFERAEKFNRDIRKLGLTAQNLSYLDQFRILITEIGNAMGYVRMIRSGGMKYISNAIKYVPDLQDIPNFQELVSADNLADDTQNAAKNLDTHLENLSKQFAEGTEYFPILVQVFGDFRKEENSHLKNFYIIIPPLTINFLQHILSAKDRLNKKSKENLFFSDDGFAIGLAYILKVLDQNTDFNSLHWFDSVTSKYEDEKMALQNAARAEKKEEKQSAILTMKKVTTHQEEFELLRFSFSGARIFFKDS